ncbi:hypothetical protein QYP21_03055 [Clostridioides difficile]|nr:hypothetical protein [Clostridioides difficile]
MRDLFRPINKDNNQHKEEAPSRVYSNIDTYIECQEENIYDLYYQDYRDQSEWEAFIEEMEIIGLLII